MVPYEGGEQTQQLALYNEEEQPKRPDPDGLTSSDHLMIMASDTKMDQVSIGTNDKDTFNNNTDPQCNNGVKVRVTR